jgi:uncharacterized protein (DUF4213/DUF364 family)
MTVALELIGLLERLARHIGLPRVRALHLPPNEGVDAKNGEFCALELEDGSLGLSFVLMDDTLARLHDAPERPTLPGRDALDLARGFAGAPGISRTLGFAAVNALSRCLFDRAGFAPPPSTDSIGQTDPRPGDHIGMIGYFRPLAARIAEVGARLTVLEIRPELAGEREGYRVTLDPGELSDCDKVMCTSAVLLNDTLDRVLAACPKASRFALVGPGAGCLPDPLFRRGVTLMGGSWITDRQGFLSDLAAGESWGRHAYKFALVRAAYPGFEALLERISP